MTRAILATLTLSTLVACFPEVEIHDINPSGTVVGDTITFDVACARSSVDMFNPQPQSYETYPTVDYNTDPARPAITLVQGAPHDAARAAAEPVKQFRGYTVEPSSNVDPASITVFCSRFGHTAQPIKVTFNVIRENP